MLIAKGLWISGLMLFLPEEKTLVVGDIHVGYEEALNRQGILVPRFAFKDIMKALSEAVSETAPEKIILLGDLKHEFGGISDQEWTDALKVLDFLKKKAEVIIVKGNHDTLLEPIARRKGVEIKDYHYARGFFFCHGDRLFGRNKDFKKAKVVVIGHEHPAIGIRDGARVERYKCFLVGKYAGKELVVLPSINPVTEGTDVLHEKLLSPYIKDIDGFRAIIVSDKPYDFGKIKKLRKMNDGADA
ncbi:metallophosphoesterase [Candidatus Woesearchaeota archaeon]|nr:metallophosphoesterase [Candidatus Woesearchaeota archaeon]